jgi:hypothetical protein
MTLDMSSKRVVSSSFDYEWKCLGCGQHGVSEAFKIRSIANSSCSKQAVILADQSFPAVLPAMGEKLCLKIVLVENAAISELVDEFLRLLGNRRVPKGSVILLFSASHLADVGVSAYAEQLVEASEWLREKLGRETLVAPLPPVLLGGCTDPSLVRSLFKLFTLSDSYYRGMEGYLEESTISALAAIKYLGTESKANWEERRIILPCRDKGKQAWSSGGKDSRAMPCSIRPLTVSMEIRVIGNIIKEIRSKLALDLDPTPRHERTVGAQSRPKKKTQYVVVGSSNARRTSKA